jgi:glycosyltransferase involved in cell wall biosynthesis
LTEASATRIAETIENILKDKELRENISKNALKEIAENHTDWDRELDKIYRYMNRPLHMKIV